MTIKGEVKVVKNIHNQFCIYERRDVNDFYKLGDFVARFDDELVAEKIAKEINVLFNATFTRIAVWKNENENECLITARNTYGQYVMRIFDFEKGDFTNNRY